MTAPYQPPSPEMKPTIYTIDDDLYVRRNAVAQEIELYKTQVGVGAIDKAAELLRFILDCESQLYINGVLYLKVGTDVPTDTTEGLRDAGKLFPNTWWSKLHTRAANFLDYIHGREWQS